MYKLKMVMRKHPNKQIDISLKGNKVIDENIIEMLSQFAGTKIRSLDFRGCLFTSFEVITKLF